MSPWNSPRLLIRLHRTAKGRLVSAILCITAITTITIHSSTWGQYFTWKNTSDNGFRDSCKNSRNVRTDAVIIYSKMRSGAAVVGEVFNRYSSVSYFYEPLCSFGTDENIQGQKKSDFLKKLLRCEFSAMDEQEYFGKSVEMDEVSKIKRTLSICFPHRSNFLRRTPGLCTSLSQCPKKFDSDKLTFACLRSIMPVAKVVRVEYLEDLRSLLSDCDLNVKVLHVVRDPLSILSSQLYYNRELNPAWKNEKVTYDDVNQISIRVCSQLDADIRLLHNQSSVGTLYRSTQQPTKDDQETSGRNKQSVVRRAGSITTPFRRFRESLPPYVRGSATPPRSLKCRSWLDQNYMLIRYEDYISNPVKITEDIFDFVGLNPTWNIRSWLENKVKVSEKLKKSYKRSTFQSTSPYNSRSFFSLDEQMEIKKKWEDYLTSREVDIMKKNCRNAMLFYEYDV